MLRIRFVTAGAVISLCSAIIAGSAAAQTATSETPGKPLQLLRIVEQPSAAKTKSHAKTAALKHLKTHTAERKRRHAAELAAATPTPESIAPAASPAAPMNVAATTAEPVQPAPALAPALAEPAAGELVIGGQTVQVASPSDVNELDLAANAHATEAVRPSTATPDTSPPPGSAAAAAPTASDVAAPTAKSDSLSAAPAQQQASPAQPQSSPVGSASWIAQILAALGGAVAAGSVAWFLIGSAPQRTYG